MVLVISASVGAVLLFEILPLLESRRKGESSPVLPNLSNDGEEAPLGGALSGVEDRTPIDQLDEAYGKVADYVSKLGSEALSKRALEVDYPLLVKGDRKSVV